MGLKKRRSFEELLRENRELILNDPALLKKIEKNIEKRREQALKRQ